MATTVFFEETVADKARPGETVEIEIGRSSFLDGENLIYFGVGESRAILDEATGRRLCEAFYDLGRYLGYHKS